MTPVIQTGGPAGNVDDGILGFSGVAFWWAACLGLMYESFFWGLVGRYLGVHLAAVCLISRCSSATVYSSSMGMLTRLLGITTTRSR